MNIATAADPHPWFHQMRAERPLHFDPEFTFFFGRKGGWLALRHKDVQQGLSDPALFSNEYQPRTAEGGLENSLALTDPPRHKQLRSLINKAFTPSVLLPLERWLYASCESLFAPHLKTGAIDFITEFASVLPARVVAQLLGVPEDRHNTFTRWSRIMLSDPNVVGMDGYASAQKELLAFLLALVEARAREPKDDLISQLLSSEIDGTTLSHAEVVSTCIAMMLGGAEPAGGLLGNAMLTFLEHPAIVDRLSRHPDQIPQAINEVLRYRCPVLGVPRRAKHEVEDFGGQRIRAGDLLSFFVSSANRDPEVFDEADTFDMDRDLSKLIAFGAGPHACIGQFLARLEAKATFEMLFQHVTDLRLTERAEISRHPSTILFRFQSLPMTFTARA